MSSEAAACVAAGRGRHHSVVEPPNCLEGIIIPPFVSRKTGRKLEGEKIRAARFGFGNIAPHSRPSTKETMSGRDGISHAKNIVQMQVHEGMHAHVHESASCRMPA